MFTSTQLRRVLSFSVALAFLGLAQVLPSQKTVAVGVAPSGLARSMNNNNAALVYAADSSMWAVVYTMDSSGSNGHLSLTSSTDHGSTWSALIPLPQGAGHNIHHNNSGNIVAGRTCNILNVAWADKSAGGLYWSTYYQAFDIMTKTWIGTPALIAKGSTSNVQFWPVDIEETPRGTIVIAVSGHRSAALGLGSWECGLAVKKLSATAFSSLKPMRNGGLPYSQNASIVAVDEVVHCCMKNNKGAYGIAYRAYDTVAGNWLQAQQVMVGPNDNGNHPTSGINAGNKSVIAADSKGGLYVLYVTGSNSGLTNNNILRMAYAKPGKGSLNSDWTDIQIIKHNATVGTNHRSVATNSGAYPKIQGGNTTYRNYSLAVGYGDNIAAVYSKAFEVFTKLYIQTFKDGAQTLPEIPLGGSTQPYSFEWITGLRNGHSAASPSWLTYGKTDMPSPGSYPNGKVEFWSLGSSYGRSLSLDTGCIGKLTQIPRISADASIPVINQTHTILFDRFPSSAGLFLAVGTKCLVPPLDLAFMNAPGCSLDVSFAIIAVLGVNASGSLSVPWAIPNNSGLVGQTFYIQGFIPPQTANPGGPVTSNALGMVISK